MLLRILIGLGLFSDIALAAEASQVGFSGLLSGLLDSGFLAKFLAVMVTVQIVLRCLAEALTRIAVWTENQYDNKLAGYLSQAAWWLGVGLGKFGVSTPTLVVEENALRMNGEIEKK